MDKLIASNITRFLFLIAFQVLILNNIDLGVYVNPYLYILFIIMLPTNAAPWLLLVLSFLTGFSVDLFSGESGFHTFATTLAGFCRIFVIRTAFPRAELDNPITPNIRTVNLKRFLTYTSIMVMIHHFTFFFIEIFILSEFFFILFCSVCSSLVTMLLIFTYQFIFVRRKEK